MAQKLRKTSGMVLQNHFPCGPRSNYLCLFDWTLGIALTPLEMLLKYIALMKLFCTHVKTFRTL